MENVTIPKSEYDILIADKEMLEDLKALNKSLDDDLDGLPHAYMKQLIEGEAPLKVFREWRGLSQSALAKQSGVNRVQIINIESGKSTGSVATLNKLATTLGILIDELVCK